MRIYDPKKVLAAVDFSELSRGVLKVAAEIGENRNAEVMAIHVARNPDYAAKYGGYGAELVGTISPSRLLEDTRVELQSNLDVMTKQVESAVPIETLVVFGEPVKEIVQFADTGDFDLLVMGTHGHNMVSRFLIGSVSEQVLRRAPCPVFLLRDKVALKKLEEIEAAEASGD
ncbi:MAG: universal stress protein [Nitrospinae bacterium]|nr:universal stress protein [Nitrospinota bacterium]